MSQTARPHPARIALLFLVTLFALMAISIVIVRSARASIADMPVISDLPEFSLIDQKRRPFTRADLNGRIHLVDFIFTSCPAVCPTMSTNMQQLYGAFEGSDEVRLLSITVDPETDTPEVLADYAQRFGVTDDRWLFLHGSIEDVVELSEKGFLLAASGLPAGHSTRLALVDDKGQVRRYYDSLSEESLRVLRGEVRILAQAAR